MCGYFLLFYVELGSLVSKYRERLGFSRGGRTGRFFIGWELLFGWFVVFFILVLGLVWGEEGLYVGGSFFGLRFFNFVRFFFLWEGVKE